VTTNFRTPFDNSELPWLQLSYFKLVTKNHNFDKTCERLVAATEEEWNSEI